MAPQHALVLRGRDGGRLLGAEIEDGLGEGLQLPGLHGGQGRGQLGAVGCQRQVGPGQPQRLVGLQHQGVTLRVGGGAQQRRPGACHLCPKAFRELPRAAEVEHAHRAIGGEQEVAGVRVGMHPAEPEDAVHEPVPQVLASPVAQRLLRLRGQPGVQVQPRQVLLREHLGPGVRQEGPRHRHAGQRGMLGEPLQLLGLLQVVHLAQQRGLDLVHHAVHHRIGGQRQIGVGQCTQCCARQLHVAGDGGGDAGVLHLHGHQALARQLCAVHLAQAGGGEGSGLEMREQRLGLLPEGLAEHPPHQGAVERQRLVLGARQLAAHTLGQQRGVHAQQLRHLERRATQLPQRTKEDAAHGGLVFGLRLGRRRAQALAQAGGANARGRHARDGAAREPAGARRVSAVHGPPAAAAWPARCGDGRA